MGKIDVQSGSFSERGCLVNHSGVFRGLPDARGAGVHSWSVAAGSCRLAILEAAEKVRMPPKVLMLVDTDLAHDARVQREAESLAGTGRRIYILCRHFDRRTGVFRPFGRGIVVIALRRPGGAGGPVGKLTRKIGTWARMIGVGRRLSANVVHAHDVDMLPPAAVLRCNTREKLVYDAHELSTEREGFSGLRPLIRLVERKLARSADLMITTTGMRADYFETEYGVSRPVVLQNRPRYHVPEQTDYLGEVFGIPDTKPILLYQGGMQPGRGLENILALAQRRPEWTFVAVGDGSLKKQLVIQAQADNLQNIHFHEKVPSSELPTITASADIGLQLIQNTCLNHYTTDSNKIFEYALAGLAVIASDFPEIRKIVNGYDIGYVVDPDDLIQLERLINDLMKTPGLLEKVKCRSSTSRRELTWETQEHSLIRAYDDLGI